MKLGGIIYLQSIADRRMKGMTRENLDIFCQLCGDKSLARVVLGTTDWRGVDEDVGKTREQQLAGTFWSTMTVSGSKLLRFDRTKKSAWAFLDVILGQLKLCENEDILNDTLRRIQNELVVLYRNISEAAAGQELLYRLRQILGASWMKKARKIKRGDNVMVDGRTTDIVIPCDLIHRFFIPLPLTY